MNKILISSENIKKNLLSLCRKASVEPSRVIPVIKSDGYGHGLDKVARILADLGVWGFGVSEVEEAWNIRKLGIDGPILMLSGLYPGQEEAAIELDLTVGVYDRAQLDALNQAGSRQNKSVSIHLKADTGMTRFGFSGDELVLIARQRHTWPFLNFGGLFSHLASADDPEDRATSAQIARFEQMLGQVRNAGWHPRCVHLANSAGAINFRQAIFGFIRPGLALYGAYPGRASQASIDLTPAMAFYSHIIALKEVNAGVAVGYSGTFSTSKPSKIAVIPVGYDNGYLRSSSNSAKVLVRGVRCPVVGNICMKSLMIDVTQVPETRIGDEVALLGQQGNDEITIEELSSWAGTISYELLCLLGTRNRREYV